LKTLIDYLLSKTSADQGFHSSLLQHRARVGLVLSERLVNMPVQVMAPMYRMLSEEIDDAIPEVRCVSWTHIRCDVFQGYTFTHYLFVSRVYRMSREEEDAQRHSKRYRATPQVTQDGVYGFHPEDEEIIQVRVSTRLVMRLMRHSTQRTR
jgi:protein BCP1